MKLKKFLLLFVILSLLSGCTSNTASNTVNDEKTDNADSLNTENKQDISAVPVSGGTLNMSMRPPKTLNPLINEDYTVDNVLKLVFEPLFTIDSNQKIVPAVASDYSVSPDGLTLTVNIRSGLNWHDGKAVTADDVVFSLDTIKSAPEGSLYKNALDYVVSYSAVGSNTVLITYSSVYSPGIYNLCFPIIPKHYYANNLALDSTASFNPIGNGNYKFVSYKVVREMILEKTSNYKGNPYIDNVCVKVIPDRETELYAFEQSVTDVITVDVSEWGKFSTAKEFNPVSIDSNNFEFLGFNFNNALLSNINLRQAVAYAVPIDEIVENIYLGNAVPSITPINPNSWYSGDNENTASYPYSLTMAGQFISKTGFTSEQLTFSILVNEENNERTESAVIIANALNHIGMNVTVNKQPFESYKQLIDNNEFDMFIGGVNFSKTPDFRPFLSSTAQETGINYFNYSDEQMDNLLYQSVSTVGDENFAYSMNELKKYLSVSLPCVGIAFKDSIVMTDSKIQGTKQPTIYNSLNNINEWYISQ